MSILSLSESRQTLTRWNGSIYPKPFGWGDIRIVSGQTAHNEQRELVGTNDSDAQVKQVFHNLVQILKAGGSSLDSVIKVNIYLTDMGNFPKIIDLRKKFLSLPYPADTIIEVRALASPGFMFEIEAIAMVFYEGFIRR